MHDLVLAIAGTFVLLVALTAIIIATVRRVRHSRYLSEIGEYATKSRLVQQTVEFVSLNGFKTKVEFLFYFDFERRFGTLTIDERRFDGTTNNLSTSKIRYDIPELYLEKAIIMIANKLSSAPVSIGPYLTSINGKNDYRLYLDAKIDYFAILEQKEIYLGNNTIAWGCFDTTIYFENVSSSIDNPGGVSLTLDIVCSEEISEKVSNFVKMLLLRMEPQFVEHFNNPSEYTFNIHGDYSNIIQELFKATRDVKTKIDFELPEPEPVTKPVQ